MMHDLREQFAAKIVEVARTAAPKERETVASLMAQAIAHAGNPDTVFVTVTPGMAALFWLNHNLYNREWRPDSTAIFAERMRAGEWRLTHVGYALFADDGTVADGGHRMAAQVVSDTTLTIPVFLGMRKEDVGAMDTGRPRTAVDLAQMRGVANAREKVNLLKSIWSYERAAKITVSVSEHNLEAVVKAVKENDVLLARALELGSVSTMDVEDGLLLLNEKAAARVIAILLRYRWPEARVTDRVDEIQTMDFISDDAPLAIARKYIEKHRKPSDAISPDRETGVIIKGIIVAETRQTVNAKGKKEIEGAVKHAPNPEYPLTPAAAADD